MIDLPSVTLFAIDCIHPEDAVDAMRFSTRHVRFAEMVLLTDLNKHPRVTKAFNHGKDRLPIRVFHHEESDRKVQCPRKEHYPLPYDYEMASMRLPSEYMTTSHLLFIEGDSAVCNPWAWQDDWLKWDYIGAPWPAFHEDGWVPCDGRTNNVGNGGFSLRSLRYCQATRDLSFQFQNEPWIISSDMGPCLTGRPWLEQHHRIKFAPDHVAARFSCENLPYSGQFGAHGKWTMEMNNWGGRFSGMRP